MMSPPLIPIERPGIHDERTNGNPAPARSKPGAVTDFVVWAVVGGIAVVIRKPTQPGWPSRWVWGPVLAIAVAGARSSYGLCARRRFELAWSVAWGVNTG
jgi:hypothetical protein